MNHSQNFLHIVVKLTFTLQPAFVRRKQSRFHPKSVSLESIILSYEKKCLSVFYTCKSAAGISKEDKRDVLRYDVKFYCEGHVSKHNAM